MKKKLSVYLLVILVAVSVLTVDSVYGAGIPKAAISSVLTWAKGDLPGTTVYTDQTNTFGAFDQLFKALNFKIVDNTDASKIVTLDNSGMTTAKTLTIKPLSTTTQTLQIPSITATDTLDTLGLAQTFTAAKTFPASGIILGGAGAGLGTLTYANSASSGTITIPAGTDTLATLGAAQTFTAAKTFPASGIILGGAGAGLGTLTYENSGTSGTITIPATTGTLATLTRINGASGAAGSDMTWQKLSADATAITVTTPTVVMTTTGVGPGTWHFRYIVIYQSAATTTGIGISVNHSGTTGTYVSDWYHVTTGGTAATGVGDQTAATNAGQLVEGKAERVINTVSSSSAGVDTINANMMAIVDGVVVVTVSGNLELKVNSEIATSGITVKADSILELNKIG